MMKKMMMFEITVRQEKREEDDGRKKIKGPICSLSLYFPGSLLIHVKLWSHESWTEEEVKFEKKKILWMQV